MSKLPDDNHGLMMLRREHKRATDNLAKCRQDIENMTDELESRKKDEVSLTASAAQYRDALTALGVEP